MKGECRNSKEEDLRTRKQDDNKCQVRCYLELAGLSNLVAVT